MGRGPLMETAVRKDWRNTVEEGRRHFLKNFVREMTKEAVTGYQEAETRDRERESFEEFFGSYESSYALTLNYPDEILLESARNEGIEVENREKIDIVREMFLKKGGI